MTVRQELSKKIASIDITFTPVDNRRLMNLCGQLDEHIRLIEQKLDVEIKHRASTFHILGKRKAAQLAHDLLNKLYSLTEKNGEHLTPELVLYHLQEMNFSPDNNNLTPDEKDRYVVKAGYKVITLRSPNQQIYVDKIFNHDVNFGIGPAGSGKTYLAVACAVAALESEKVRRIILVRPAVEAGERLGFLPGDLSQKIDPYLRPLYDALYEMLGFEKVAKLIERNIIELAPLAYMRGRTLSDAFIILDESQNTTKEQMKMFLTRIGFGSTAIITGDVTQIDLPHGVISGLKQAINVFHNIPGMSFTFFESSDIVRHPIVQKIVDAYDRYEHSPGKDIHGG